MSMIWITFYWLLSSFPIDLAPLAPIMFLFSPGIVCKYRAIIELLNSKALQTAVTPLWVS